MTSDFPVLLEDPQYSAMEAGDNDLLEFEGWNCRYTQKNNDLQDALGKAGVERHELSEEIALLQKNNKSLRKEITELQYRKKKEENLRFKVKQNELPTVMQQQPKHEKERRCLQMVKRDQLKKQSVHCKDETLVLKNEVTRLRNLIIGLKKKLHLKKLELEEKEEFSQKMESKKKFLTTTLNQYATAIEVLNNQKPTLQIKVEEAFQGITRKNTNDESSRVSGQFLDDGTLMYEIVQAKLDEEQLLKSEQQEKLGFLGLRLLCTTILKIMWCNTKVLFFSGFFILLFHYLLTLNQGKEPGFLGWFILSVFSSETSKWIQQTLHPYLQYIGSDGMPT
ncbi:uncharacterized protein ACNLHF_006338 isoform 2-T6 [Anomaloglossus baeobatrachus]|uniref:uncharacterized protein LOC142296664 isoform X2 n=1 Tax=Anomaloglossus baeobatrachus TaxID=238106 RepID=UPI003F50A03D